VPAAAPVAGVLAPAEPAADDADDGAAAAPEVEAAGGVVDAAWPPVD